MIKTKSLIIKIDSWINTKLNRLAWYNKMAIVLGSGIFVRMLWSLL